MRRIAFFDGLRGVCALQVMLFHCAACFSFSWGTQLLDAGQMPVAVFFLMSGYVLTGSFRSARAFPARTVLARFIRLAFPAVVSAALAMALICLFYQRAAWLGGYLHNPSLSRYAHLPTMVEAIHEVDGFDILFGYADTAPFHVAGMVGLDRAMNSPLWTISYELMGSFWVLCLVLSTRFKALYGVLLGSTILLFGSNYLTLFTLGHLGARYELARRFSSAWVLVLGAAFIGAAIYIGVHPHLPKDVVFVCQHGLAIQPGAGGIAGEIAGTLLFFGVLLIPSFQSALCMGPFQSLGRISFSLYLVHFPLLMTIGVGAYVATMSAGTQLARVAAVSATILAATLASIIFERLVDRPSIQLSRIIKGSPVVAVSQPNNSASQLRRP